MRASGFRKSLIAVYTAALVVAAPVFGQEGAAPTIGELFETLQGQGGSSEDVLVAMIEQGISLNEAAGYSVANAGSIGLSIGYAQTAICLAPDQPAAQVVGQIAADSAEEAGRNAVQAAVVSALSSYASGECQLLLDELNNASQAFAAGDGAPGGDASAGGGAEPPPPPPPPVSESQ